MASREPETRVFESGATRDAATEKLDYEGFLSPLVLAEFAKYMHKCRFRNIPTGESIRKSDNWQLGIPREQYAKSLIRHVMEFWIQHRDAMEFGLLADEEKMTDTLMAILFNVQGYMYERIQGR